MKKILILLVAMVMAAGAEARTIRDFFVSEPGKLLMLLPKTNRLDMLDYYDNGQKVLCSNNLGYGTQFITVEENFLHVRMSESKTMQMLLTVNKKDTVIAVIESYKTPLMDSRISFYDTRWIPLNTNKYLQVPEISNFFLKSVSKDERAALLQDLKFPIIEYTFEGEGHKTLVVKHHLKEFLGAKEYAPYEKAMVPELTYELKGTSWKLIKK